MLSWEAGPTPYAGPTSPARPGRAELDALGAAAATVAPSSAAPLTAAPLWLDVLDETTGMCAAYGRADLAAWLRRRRAQLLDPQLRVLVVGVAAQGKSQLINALVNAPVCAVRDDRGTSVPTVVRHAAAPAAFLVRRAPDATDGTHPADWLAGARPEDRVELPLGRDVAVGRLIADRAAADELAVGPTAGGDATRAGTVAPRRSGPLHAEVRLPRSLLAAGLVLVDTPPLGELPRADEPELGTLVARTRADLVLLVCESTRELTAAEVAALASLRQVLPDVVVVLTKTDVAPRWRRVLESTRARLAEAGVPATVVAVSSALRLHAARTGDEPLNAESGFPQLIAYLREAVAAKPDGFARAVVGRMGRMAIEELVTPLREQLAGQQDGGSSAAMARLHEAQRRVDELRRCATRWQNCLSDEVADLMSDIEHDLRERTRAILATVEETFETADPLRVWETFEPWLQQALREAAEASFGWLVERTDWMAQRVAAHFPPDMADVLPQWAVAVPDDLPEKVNPIGTPRVERFTATQKLFTGLRGSYGGVLMFGLATSLTGMSLINPISLGAGAVFGGKSVRDESKSMLKRRQAVARAAVARHVDEVFVTLNKEAKDTVRRVQRVLRDHFSAVTEDLQDRIVESLRDAKRDADHDAAAREQRLRRVQQELGRLAELYDRVQALSRVGRPAVPAQRGPTS